MVLIACLPLSIATFDADLAHDADISALIVLGAAIYGDRPSPVFAARLDYARDLLRAGRAGMAIITGGVGEGEKLSEAEVGRDYLLAQGIPEDQILVEIVSRTTFENLCHARLILQPLSGERYAVVSDPLHLRRAMQLASDAGLDAVPAATPYTRYRSFAKQAQFVLRESYFYARRLITGRRRCVVPQSGVAALTGWREPDPKAVASVDAETPQRKLERLVAIAGKKRSELEWAQISRAHGQLDALAKAGIFDAFVACSNDPRPVWPELAQQTAGPTTVGHVCLDFIAQQVDALYLKKEGLGIVTAQNAQEWWHEHKGKPLAELQIETLSAYRTRVAERSADAGASTPVLDEIDRRLERARGELARGERLTIDRTPAP